MTCEVCRADHEESGDEPPCEGCTRCTDLFPENVEIWEYFWDVQLVGKEMADKFYQININRIEADMFFLKYKMMQGIVNKHEREQLEKAKGKK